MTTSAAEVYVGVRDVVQATGLPEKRCQRLLRDCARHHGTSAPENPKVSVYEWECYVADVLGWDIHPDVRAANEAADEHLLRFVQSFSESVSVWSVVYFIQASRQRLIKIGTTRNLERRLKDFLLHYPEPPTVLATVRGGKRLERRLHQHFANSRCHHEWFKPTQELMALIALLSRGADLRRIG